MSFESAVYRLVAEPANPNCDTDCDKTPECAAITYGDSACSATQASGSTTVRLRPSSIERSGAFRSVGTSVARGADALHRNQTNPPIDDRTCFCELIFSATAAGAVLCGVCCVLPFALPAVALASSGTAIAWLALGVLMGHNHRNRHRRRRVALDRGEERPSTGTPVLPTFYRSASTHPCRGTGSPWDGAARPIASIEQAVDELRESVALRTAVPTSIG